MPVTFMDSLTSSNISELKIFWASQINDNLESTISLKIPLSIHHILNVLLNIVSFRRLMSTLHITYSTSNFSKAHVTAIRY